MNQAVAISFQTRTHTVSKRPTDLAYPIWTPYADIEWRWAARQALLAKGRAQTKRAVDLSVAISVPTPNQQVLGAAAAATRSRQKAGVAIHPQTRKAHLQQAQRFDQVADRARAKQLEEHWLALADTEIVTLAEGRGEDIRLVTTEVPDWVRDEYGAIVRKEGLPVQSVLRAKARARRTGLEHVRAKLGPDDKPIMSDRLYGVGETYGQVCADAAKALLGGREETGAPSQGASKPSPGPADWKLEAMAKKKLADYRLRIALGDVEGVAMTKLLEAICYEGLTPRQYAGGDERSGIRAEERLLIGLNILGARGDFTLVKVGEH